MSQQEQSQAAPMIQVEVAYALENSQAIIALSVPQGSNILETVELSKICSKYPQIDVAQSKMGIFGKLVAKPVEHIMASGERVEIYRPLIADPKEARKNRAAKLKASK